MSIVLDRFGLIALRTNPDTGSTRPVETSFGDAVQRGLNEGMLVMAWFHEAEHACLRIS